MRRSYVLMLFMLIFTISSLAYADVVKMKDGKKLEGKITERTQEYVRLRTGYGELTIPRADIDSISLSPSTVHLKDGRRMEGIITEETTQKVVLLTRYGQLVIGRSDIEKIERPGEYLPVKREERPGPAPKPTKKLTSGEIGELHRKALDLLRAKKYDDSIALYKKIVASRPYDIRALYNLACAYSLKGDKAPALDYLERALEAGFAAFAHIEKDSDLDNIRNEPRYKSLIARKEELIKRGARRRAKALKEQYGKDYIVEVDDGRKIIYVAYQSRLVLQQLKKALNEYADAQWNTLFDNKPGYYITVFIPSGEDFRKEMGISSGGRYDHGPMRLICSGTGIILRHEFTHALHLADLEPRGQIHPIWIVEGLATCFEDSTIVDGKPTPMPNFRLNIVRKALATGRYIPWERFFKLSQGQFGQNTVLCYAEARYIIYYFYHAGKLKEFYDAFCENFSKDKTGKLALEKVFGKSLAEVRKDFEKWIAHAPEPLGETPKGKPFFGVATQATAAGMRVARVVPGSAAQTAGIKPGDIITEFAGRKYTNSDMFREAIRAQKVGKPITVKLLRGDKEIEFEVTLRPKD